MSRCIFHGLRSLHVGILKQPELEFRTQYASHGAVDIRLFNFAALYKGFEIGKIDTVFHIHVDACRDTLRRCLALVGGDAVRYEFADTETVADHKTVEAPFVTQNICHKIFIARRRHSIVGVERGHECEHALIFGCLERRKIGLPEFALAHSGGVVVASALSRTVGHKMLGTCGYRCRRPQRVAVLKAGGHSPRQYRCKIRVFAKALGNTAPAGVAGNVDHRGEGPAHAVGRSLHGCHAGTLLNR